MNKPDLSKTAKYRMRSDGLWFHLEERKTLWLFTWWKNILTSPFPEDIRVKAIELTKKDEDEAI